MSWKISRYRVGDHVEVLSQAEILATLDEKGCCEGLPFMPEMLAFCGKHFPVRAVAHKTCETARGTNTSRRLNGAVHLADLRCDGAACSLIWKDAWLKPAKHAEAETADGPPPTAAPGCTEAQLLASTQLPVVDSEEGPCYSCQATRLWDATQPLPWWNPRQYLLDATTGNFSAGRVLRVAVFAALRFPWRVIRRIPVLRSVYSPVNEGICHLFSGRESPYLFKHSTPLTKTPTGRLDLQPGELVRIKSREEIEKTLDAKWNNRGLSFDPEEMAPYCGGVYRVHSSVTKIIDERTGHMREMKQPCIILQGVVCNAEYARRRLNCPRIIYAYWRELWLERVEEEEPQGECPLAQQIAEPAPAVD